MEFRAFSPVAPIAQRLDTHRNEIGRFLLPHIPEILIFSHLTPPIKKASLYSVKSIGKLG